MVQATVGLLVAKTLSNATANPFLAGGTGSYNPVVALDVFLVQARSRRCLALRRPGYRCADSTLRAVSPLPGTCGQASPPCWQAALCRS